MAAKRSIDELLAALDTITRLTETVGKHDQAIARLAGKLDDIVRRLEALEPADRA